MKQTNYNPDVLTCLANLSSDEVFTPPNLANKMLDLLPKELWSNKDAKFLDPVSKTGVFLREIAKRLLVGLEKEIPDRQKRIDHIFKNQLYGIAITELTALLSRRTLYCSKTANGKYSVGQTFDNEKGNIEFNNKEHSWVDRNCKYCGASKDFYERTNELESHAYEFIHTTIPEKIYKNMKFDVIIGNPPYQLNDGGGRGSSATPIYNKFVEQAKKLNPRFLTMIIPSRWYSGGKGLDEFRFETLNDSRIRVLVDFLDSRECFPGVDIAGGVCYFLWDRDNQGQCKILTIRKGQSTEAFRDLNEFETFIRDNVSVDIVKKVQLKSKDSLSAIVSSRNAFGLTSNDEHEKTGDLKLITSSGEGKISSGKIRAGKNLVAKWKVLVSKASYDHGGQPDKEGKRKIFSRIEVLPPNTVCTETYLVVGPFESEVEANNIIKYLKTKFSRFLVSTILLTQNITKNKFMFVPQIDLNKTWKDEELFKFFELTDKEIEFIEATIRSME